MAQFTIRRLDERSTMAASVLEMGGEENFNASAETLYATLTDIDVMATRIPDLVSSEKIDERTLRCVVRPGFSFLRGTMKLTMAIDPTEPPKNAEMQINAKGIGVTMQVTSSLEVTPNGEGSTLKWTGRVEKMTGLVATISPSLVKAAADQVIRKGWSEIRKQLGES